MTDFADIIKTERKAHELKRAEFAALIGVSDGAVGMWEAGLSRPSYANMVRISRDANMPAWVRDLFYGILDAALIIDAAS